MSEQPHILGSRQYRQEVHAASGETFWTTLSICAVYLHSPTQTEQDKSRDFEHVRREKLKDSTEEDTAVGFILSKDIIIQVFCTIYWKKSLFFSILRGYLKRLSPSTEVRNLLLHSMRLPKLVSLDLNDFVRLHLLTCSQFRLQSGDLLFTKAQKCGAGEWRLGQDKDPYKTRLRKSNAMTCHVSQCVDSFHVDHACSLCPQLLKSAAFSKCFGSSSKFHLVPNHCIFE